uniref:Uncharacterized protein LOC114341522 n=1 Tax=Diabrotica virgifera virgifera TaxID=50390 RepID=A0A6P7GEW5_DIAVI
MFAKETQARGDKLELVNKILSFGIKRQYYWLIVTCCIIAIAVIEGQIILAGTVMYHKYGTWKPLVPYITTSAIAQSGCIGLFIICRFIHKLKHMLDTITTNSNRLPIQDILFENTIRKQAINMKR